MVVNRCCVGPDLKEEKERAMQSRWRGVPGTGSAYGPPARGAWHSGVSGEWRWYWGGAGPGSCRASKPWQRLWSF